MLAYCCKPIKKEPEDIVHFITKCKGLESKRDYKVIDKNIKNQEERMRILLFRSGNHQSVSRLLRNLWELRKKLLKQIEKSDIKNNQEEKS